MSLVKKILAVTTSLLLGALFIYSAYTKLFPIEPLEISLADIGIGWKLAPFLARFLVGSEFALGFLFVFLFRLRKFTIPAAAALLGVFIVYLLLLFAQYGNRGSCGCFGEAIPMTPIEGIIKNIILLSMLFILYKTADEFHFKFKTAIAILGMIVLLALPYILNPTSSPFQPRTLESYHQQPIDLNSLYAGDDSTGMPPAVDLRKGKHIIAFLSLRCPHCRIAAKKLNVIKKQHPDIPLFFVLAGSDEKMKEFFDDTKTDSIPYMHFRNTDEFLRLTHASFPQIYWVNNSVIEYDCNYFELNDVDIEKWLNKK